MINWHEELTKGGFTFLEDTTRTYGNKDITGQINYYNFKTGNIIENVDYQQGDYKKSDLPFISDVFIPFFSNRKEYRSIIITNIEQLNKYLYK